MQRRHILTYVHIYVGFSGGSVVKNLPANAGKMGLIPGWEDLLEKEKVSSLGNPMDRDA